MAAGIKTIIEQLHDPQHGQWKSDGEHLEFKPNPSFFGRVEPMELVDYFNKQAPKNTYLDMGDYE